jgi:O-acetyl-ADP-ribose deacetylase (regulator of RNase III)
MNSISLANQMFGESAILQVVVGDITQQPECEAIVNSANTRLIAGSGVCGAIFRAAGGNQLEKACRPFAPLRLTKAVITPAFGLPNHQIIHCVGPRYHFDVRPSELLERCYSNLINLAEASGVESIAMPAISTGVYAFPFEEATAICVKTIVKYLPTLKHLKLIRFVVVSNEMAAIYQKAIDFALHELHGESEIDQLNHDVDIELNSLQQLMNEIIGKPRRWSGTYFDAEDNEVEHGVGLQPRYMVDSRHSPSK